ncbi:MAG TPA: phosphoribosylaminoimidazolesuccinocarboxamide synthase [Candidatus Paceibacterota bacterium]|jgi:phosphoribosylaminoimidazole-succinocarboxamide synthase
MTSLDSILPHFHSGKVRDTYLIPEHPALLVPRASDRLSTHNRVHKSEVPLKGELLAALTVYWALEHFDGIPTHLVAWGKKIYDYLPGAEYDPREHYRTCVVRRMYPDLYEFVHRDYLTGSLLKAYENGEDPYFLGLPPGLPSMHRFSRTVFTPTHKSEDDEPLDPQIVRDACPESTEVTLIAFSRMQAHLASRGITLIDAKFEAAGGVLIDEWGTGDCSRMARTSEVQEGRDPPWLDKEFLRREAEHAWGTGPRAPLEFPLEALKAGAARYHEAFEAITGMSLSEFQRSYMD